jgi:two-component system, NarL family, invasion response regulator UvrY
MLNRTRIYLLDDHSLVRAGLREAIEKEADLALEGEFGTVEELNQALERALCDVLLLDLGLSETSGMEVLRQVNVDYPAVRVLIVSGHPESKFAGSALRAGARGFVSKGANTTELVRAIRMVAKGDVYKSRALADQTAGSVDDTKAPHERLSERENQIFLGLAKGATVTELGESFSLSIKTVSTYRTRILEKLEVKSNADLTAYALRNALIS